MKYKIATFTEDMIPPVVELLRECFHGMSEPHLRNTLCENPLTKKYPGRNGAVILREDGKISGFTAEFPMELYFRRKLYLGSSWGMTMVRPEAGICTAGLFRFLRKRPDVAVYYSNTANEKSEQLHHILNLPVGPRGCTGNSLSVIDWPAFFGYACRKKKILGFLSDWLLRKLLSPLKVLNILLRPPDFTGEGMRIRKLDRLDPELFGRFHQDLIEENPGLMVSRSPEILHWIYEENNLGGRIVLLGCFRVERLIGYLSLRLSRTASGTTGAAILDWIAVGNDPATLESLLSDACRYCRGNHIFLLTLWSYPDCASGMVHKYFRFFERKISNHSMCLIADRELREEYEKNPEKSWIWGPFDGDFVLCDQDESLPEKKTGEEK